MARNLEAGVVRLREAGVDVLLGTGVDAADSPLVKATRSRVGIYNALIWSMARRHGAYVVDLWGMRSLRDWRMWAEDRIHLTTDGHARVAQGALVGLGLEPDDAALGRPAHAAAADPADAEGPRGRRLGARARLPVGDAAAAREVVRRRARAEAAGAVAAGLTSRQGQLIRRRARLRGGVSAQLQRAGCARRRPVWYGFHAGLPVHRDGARRRRCTTDVPTERPGLPWPSSSDWVTNGIVAVSARLIVELPPHRGAVTSC